jgi:hypothetical protein
MKFHEIRFRQGGYMNSGFLNHINLLRLTVEIEET